MPESPATPEQKLDHDLPRQAAATRFWWVRHAPVSHLSHLMYGTQDVDADVSDIHQIHSLTERLPTNALWYTSNLKRTAQTADAVAAQGLTCKNRFESPLIAEMDFGDDTGKTHAELIAERDDPYVGFWPRSPVLDDVSGESMSDVRKRISQFMEQCAQQHPREDIICFSHMGAILAALAHSLELANHNSICFSIDNLSITRINHYATLHPQAPNYRVMTVSEYDRNAS